MKNEIIIFPGDKVLHEGKFLSQAVRTYQGTDGGIKKYEMVVRNNVQSIVAGLPVTKEGNFLISRQFRIPLGRPVYENAAGLVDAGETCEEAMLRELREETGYSATELRRVGQVPTSSGLTNEIVDCFILLGVEKTGEPETETSESIETLIIRDDDMDEWFMSQMSEGNLVDPKVMMLVSYYRRWIRDITKAR